LAATAVIFYHSILVEPYFFHSVLPIAVQDLPTYGDWAAKVALSCFHGQTAVIIFFVLSGLVLRLSLDRAGDVGSVALYNFIIRRLLRLYPAILFALAFCFAISWVWKTGNFPGAERAHFQNATNFRLLFENAVLWGAEVQAATWTIQTELAAIPFILLIFIISRAAGVVATLLCLAYAVFAMDTPWMVGTFGQISLFLPAFIAGMLLVDRRLGPMYEGVRPWTLWAGIAALVAARLFLPSSGVPEYAGNIFLCALFVGCVYYSKPEHPVIQVLVSRPIQFLGRISYSLYLVNVPIIWVFIPLTPRLGLNRLGALDRGLIVGLLVTILSIPIAAFSEKYVEQPGIRLGRLLSTRSRARAGAGHGVPQYAGE
jgi:peptidoglycan/LPS O-acetylase OafA/YrhL